MTLTQWAIRHGVSHTALHELQQMWCIDTNPTSCTVTDDRSEASVQTQVRLAASRAGIRLWRNNVGACKDETGRVIRYGLCNESAQINKALKSSDLIGIRPLVITDDMVGHTIGQFIAREVKRPGWKYTGTSREVAQLAYGQIVTSLGGDFKFTTGDEILT